MAVARAPAPELPADLRLVGDAVSVTFCEASSSGVTLRFDAEGRNADELRIVLADEGGGVTVLTSLYDAGSIETTVDSSGTYAAVAIARLDGCNGGTLQGNVEANTDAALAAFEGVTRLDGDLTIGGTVSTLTALRCITWIAGKLTISGATVLKDVELGRLVQIDRGISVERSNAIETVAFPGLLFAGDDEFASLAFNTLPALHALRIPGVQNASARVLLYSLGSEALEELVLDFGSLRSVGSSLSVEMVSNLQRFEGFDRLRTVGGDLSISYDEELVSTDGLTGLEGVSGVIAVLGNPLLESVNLRSLSTLDSPSGGIRLWMLPALTKVDLHSVDEIPGELWFSSVGTTANAPLVVDASDLVTVGYLGLASVENLEDLDSFQGLERITGELSIVQTALSETDGLENLREVGSRIGIRDNDRLRSVAFPSLRSAGAATSDSAAIELSNLSHLEVVDLRSLVECPWDLDIHDTGGEADAPLTIDTSALTDLGGHLSLSHITNLHDLSGFSTLEWVHGDVGIVSNPTLSNLHGLTALTNVAGNLYVTNNVVLPTCEATWLRDHLQPDGLQGSATISGNLADTCQ